MSVYSEMKTHFILRRGRIVQRITLALLCALMLSSSALAMSRHKREVTLPGAEGHPAGDWGDGSMLAGVARSIAGSIIRTPLGTYISAPRMLKSRYRASAPSGSGDQIRIELDAGKN